MKCVLIVDDKADNRYLLQTLLKGHGFAVEAASHGLEALAKADARPPDLIISDLLMPEMDGYSLLRRWRSDQRLRAIPFIVYTATYTDPKDEELAFQLGADAFIVKPTEPESFMQQVREVLDRVEGKLHPGDAPTAEEGAMLKLYNAALIRKLEHKCAQLELRVSELIRSEVNLIRMSRCHNTLGETSQAIVHIADQDELLRVVCGIAVERGGFALAGIDMLNAATGDVIPAAWHGGDWWPSDLGRLNVRGPWRTPVEIALGQGGPYVCNDIQRDPALAQIEQHLRERALHACASCPMRIGEHIVGALTVFAGDKNCFDDTMKSLVTQMATEVSFALENHEKEEVRAEAEEELLHVTSDLENLVEVRTAELVEANKELEAFSYSVSHDLRAPLGAISGFTTTVIERNEGKLDASSLSLLKRVHAGAERMELLIDDLIDLSRVSRKEMQSQDFDLSESALNVASALRLSDAARKVRIEVAPGMNLRADPGLMRIALENLIGNAWKFTSKTSDPLIEIGSDHGADGSTIYYVRDNGAGFDMDYACKLFSPFQRLHSASEFPGSGIGLSIVQRIFTRHRGRIWGESVLGQGATFRFTLPAQRPEKIQRPRPDVGEDKTSV